MPFNKQGILYDATAMHHVWYWLIYPCRVNYAVFTDKMCIYRIYRITGMIVNGAWRINRVI